jgi:hypothetical protein
MPKFKKGDILYMEEEYYGAMSRQLIQVLGVEPYRDGWYDYKVQMIVDTSGQYTGNPDYLLQEIVDRDAIKLNRTQVKLFKLLYT